MALDLTGLKKAIVSLDEAILFSNNLPGLSVNVSPEEAEPRTKKDLFRLSAKKQMILDPELWFEFAEARNLVAYTYSEKNAVYVYEVTFKFLPSVKALYEVLEQYNA